MSHPLSQPDLKDLRQRVVSLLKSTFSAERQSNFIFVCGGNNDQHMRMLFREYCRENLKHYDVFLPEYAIDNALSSEPEVPFDLADFETLICELSHAIVVFPEAPGSYAETGYFSARDEIAGKCILALDSSYQNTDSFISLGPARKISERTYFHPLIQLDYSNPDFSQISERIKRGTKNKTKKYLEFEEFSDLSTYEHLCLLHEVVKTLSVSTIDDILYFYKVIFKNRFSSSKIKKLLSILVGAEYLVGHGSYGYLSVNSKRPVLLSIRDGNEQKITDLRIELFEIYQKSGGEFGKHFYEVSNAS